MYDIIIIGAGPAGLSAAIKLKQINRFLKIGILEKSPEIGAHILSGAILDKETYIKYLKNFKSKNIIEIKNEKILFLTKNHQFNFELFTPNYIKNKGNYLISLNELCVWQALIAQDLKIDIYTNYGVKDIIINNNILSGVITNDNTKILAKYFIIAEGTSGTICKKLIKKYNLYANQPQKFAIGIKEIWSINNKLLTEGDILHTLGWPLNKNIWGGGFIYKYKNSILSIGLVIHLKYKNPYLNLYEKFQEFKNHYLIKNILLNGKRISYGSKIISTGGLKSIPNTYFPGGSIIGCSAGLVNILKLKGIHNAIVSGINVAEMLLKNKFKLHSIVVNNWFEKSVIKKELDFVKNISQILNKFGIVVCVIEFWLKKILNISFFNKIKFLKSDNKTTDFAIKNQKYKNWNIKNNKNISLTFSNIKYKTKISHILIKNYLYHKIYDLKLYDKLSEKFCTAGVYEWIKKLKHYNFVIKYEGCLQCKTCFVKSFRNSIKWCIPRNGGPCYINI